MFLDLIAGARPNFMKVASIIRAIDQRRTNSSDLAYRLVHTGQHYDHNMSAAFFQQLEIPEPEVNLEVGSGTQAEQTSAIMIAYEQLLQENPPSLCVVVGDVNSTMACAISARKRGVRVAHVEAGIRSGDMSMPEEINRIVTDSISNFFFTTSETANQNLAGMGIPGERIFFVGNTMIDTLLANRSRFLRPGIWDEKGLSEKNYLMLTLHRPSNVDHAEEFFQLLEAIGEGARGLPVIYPVHPRSSEKIKQLGKIPENIKLVAPQPYLEFNYLVRHAKAVITDSGGITEETTVMGIPCMTLRDSTERPETISLGTNELVGTNPEKIKPCLDLLFSGKWKDGKIPPKWDGRSGERIVRSLEKILLS